MTEREDKLVRTYLKDVAEKAMNDACDPSVDVDHLTSWYVTQLGFWKWLITEDAEPCRREMFSAEVAFRAFAAGCRFASIPGGHHERARRNCENT